MFISSQENNCFLLWRTNNRASNAVDCVSRQMFYVYFTTCVCVCARASAYVCAYLWFVLIYVGLKYFQHHSPTYVIFLCRGIYNFISMQGLNVTWQLSWSHLRSAVPSNTSIRLNVSKARLHTKARLIYLYIIFLQSLNGIWSHCERCVWSVGNYVDKYAALSIEWITTRAINTACTAAPNLWNLFRKTKQSGKASHKPGQSPS